LPDHIAIHGVKPYDGRYELDLGDEFTTREWGWIKRLSGYLPATLTDDAMSDPELACVLAVIVLHRVGRIERTEVPTVFDRLLDAPFGSAITIEVGENTEDTDGDAGPPLKSSNENSDTNGAGSLTSSETSEVTPPATGMPVSDISVSPPTRLVT
jgi:hypothetical protein